MMMIIHEAGISYLVDVGRVGYLKDGIPEGGPLDDVSAGLAHALLGSYAPQSPWWLEIGPAAFSLSVEKPCMMAVVGAPRAVFRNQECVNSAVPASGFLSQLDQDMTGVALVLSLDAGDSLSLSAAVRGVVTYLTCDAEVRETVVLGSQGYCPVGDFPGLAGRRIHKRERIHLARSFRSGRRPRVRAHLNAIAASQFLTYPRKQILRFSPVGEFVAIREEQSLQLLDTFGPFSVMQADRRALRLRLPAQLRVHSISRNASSPTVRGLVQWPALGAPILLGPDRQTVGGYARFGVIRKADHYKVGRLWPGCSVTFERCDTACETDRFEKARHAWMTLVKNHIAE
ncbi:hypothetical protein ATW55_07445 [Ferroacidibacillus organovorans]|uniref:Carboxyltransferase domain-containing protein n=2 Tax=Ferroacidibacillus organovorans TaxID=1765683 RepID=A0A101XSF3_9BACL|nr:hypothetical protein ATW55_07445 [Ferroacidibacillus organovorans]